MKEKNALSRIYDTVLSIPGMQENVKLTLNLSRTVIFFLNRVVERGVSKQADADSFDQLGLPDGLAEELNTICTELLSKAGLKEMNEKLKGL